MQHYSRKEVISPGFVLGIISALCIVIGVCAPAIDFSAFNSSVDLQYNLLKICKNIGLISDMWRAIPVGFFIAAAMMLVLSFVKIPAFRVIPCMLAIAMVVLMALDMGNIIKWINDVLEKYFESDAGLNMDISRILHSLMYGIYLLAAGILTGVASIFVK
jgi:hypothetical protein